MVAAHVNINSRSARHVAEHTMINGGLKIERARPLQPVHQNRIAEADFDDLVEIFENRIELFRQIESLRHVVTDAARRDAAAQQPIAGELFIQSQQPLAQPKTVRVREGESRVVCDHSEVGDVVVEPLHLQQDNAQEARAFRDLGPGSSFERLAVGERMANGSISRNAFGQFHSFGGRAAFKQLLRPLVCEVEPNLQINYRLADDAEAEVPGLDDARMNRSDGNLINTFAADWQKRKGPSVVLEIVARLGVFAQREVIFRPKRVSYERPRIRMANGLDAEKVINFSLKAGSRIVERGQRGDRQALGRDLFGGMKKPVFPVLGKEIVDLKNALVSATVIGDHQDQLSVEIAAQKFGQRRRISAHDPAMQFVAALDLHAGRAALEMFEKSRFQSRKASQ